MKKFYRILFCLLLPLMVALAGCSDQNSSSDDPTTKISADDPKMNAAIAKARETLPQFWARFDKPQPGEDTFSLKVRIRDGGQVEHFWVEKVEKKDGKIFGSVGNDPDLVHNVKLGDRIEIPEADISDWLYMRDGKMVGNYTLRVLFDHMSAGDVKKYKALLADP